MRLGDSADMEKKTARQKDAAPAQGDKRLGWCAPAVDASVCRADKVHLLLSHECVRVACVKLSCSLAISRVSLKRSIENAKVDLFPVVFDLRPKFLAFCQGANALKSELVVYLWSKPVLVVLFNRHKPEVFDPVVSFVSVDMVYHQPRRNRAVNMHVVVPTQFVNFGLFSYEEIAAFLKNRPSTGYVTQETTNKTIHLRRPNRVNPRQAVSLSDQLSSRQNLDLELPVWRRVVVPTCHRWLLDAQSVSKGLLRAKVFDCFIRCHSHNYTSSNGRVLVAAMNVIQRCDNIDIWTLSERG
jgi:hypothetical protein